MGELAVAAAGSLRDRISHPIGRPDHAAALAAHLREADRLAAVVTTGAPHALVPPIDREDAAELAARLRDVVDAVRRASRLADMIRPDLPDATATLLADLLVQAADSLEGAVVTLTDRFRVLDFAGDVRQTAREGERAYGQAMGVLLAAGPDPLSVLRLSETYRALRAALRACARAAGPVERVVLKRF